MSDFPGYIEINCPFCDNYKHVLKAEMHELRERRMGRGEVICDECWKVLQRFIDRARNKAQPSA